MKKETLSRAVGKIAPCYVGEALEFVYAPGRGPGEARPGFRVRRRAAVCAGAALLAAVLVFGTAFAADASFRRAVVSVLFPRYSESKLREIDGGRGTGSFDAEDVLCTFLDRFNSERMEPGLSAEKQGGYRYSLLSEGSGTAEAIVDCNRSDYKLLVTLKREPYRNTVGLWQTVSYRVLDSAAAESMREKGKPYVPDAAAPGRTKK